MRTKKIILFLFIFNSLGVLAASKEVVFCHVLSHKINSDRSLHVTLANPCPEFMLENSHLTVGSKRCMAVLYQPKIVANDPIIKAELLAHLDNKAHGDNELCLIGRQKAGGRRALFELSESAMKKSELLRRYPVNPN